MKRCSRQGEETEEGRRKGEEGGTRRRQCHSSTDRFWNEEWIGDRGGHRFEHWAHWQGGNGTRLERLAHRDNNSIIHAGIQQIN